MKWIMFWINLVVFFFLFIFVNWRLTKIAEEVNDIIKSKILFGEEKKLKILNVILFFVLFVIINIYIFTFF